MPRNVITWGPFLKPCKEQNTALQNQIHERCPKAAKLKWDWTGHVCHMLDEKWAKKLLNGGRPRRTRRDEIDAYRKYSPDIANDCVVWKRERAAFVQQWDKQNRLDR